MAFWQLTVPTSPETADGLTNFLWEQGALGVVEEEEPPEPPRLRAFFAETASSTALINAVRAYRASLSALGLPVSSRDAEIGPLHDEAWASAWQQSFPSRLVGERLVVQPPWEATAPPDGRIAVVIEPGRAFGTGHHGSTEGCLVMLERALGSRPSARVLDVGAGSGILSVAAVKLGASTAVAIDIDPDAATATRANAEKNGCAGRIAVAVTGPESVTDGPFAVVVANLLTHTHLALAGVYARLVAPGGALVAGGILADEGPRVEAALASEGFVPLDRVVIEGWSSLALDRPAARGPAPLHR